MGHPAEKLRRPPATHADYAAVPDHLHAEIIRGTLHVVPRPAPRHALSSSRLGGRLDGPFGLGDGGTRGRIRPFEAIEIALSVLRPD